MNRVRALALPVLLLAVGLSGCVVTKPGLVQEGDHSVAPIVGEGVRNLDAKGFEVEWRNPATGVMKPFTWEATYAQFVDGVFIVESEPFTLRYRVDEPIPVKLRYDETLARKNTFNFTYREPVADTGRAVTAVLEVDPDSFMDARTADYYNGDVAGAIVLSFEGTCAEGDEGCEEPGARRIVLLDIRFPPKTH